MIELRMATSRDIKKIIDFIRDHWHEKHIFVRWPALFSYCHHIYTDSVNYALAMENDTIYGVCGYIASNRTASPDVWVALWKVIPSGSPSLGLELLEYVREKTNCRIFCCCGINKKVMKLYQFFGYHTGTLEHYYRLADRNTYHIALVKSRNILPATASAASLIPLKADELRSRLNQTTNQKPYKDMEYIQWRYYNHISYQYQVYGIDNGLPGLDSVLITREVSANGEKALRVVDFIGIKEDLLLISSELQLLLERSGYEYMDFYLWGIPENILNSAGFIKRTSDDPNIIPNYFEPFTQENIDIHFFSNELDGFTMFKADGDQDRPNIIPGE